MASVTHPAAHQASTVFLEKAKFFGITLKASWIWGGGDLFHGMYNWWRMVRRHEGDAPSASQAGSPARMVAQGAGEEAAVFRKEFVRLFAALKEDLGGRRRRSILADVVAEAPGAKGRRRRRRLRGCGWQGRAAVRCQLLVGGGIRSRSATAGARNGGGGSPPPSAASSPPSTRSALSRLTTAATAANKRTQDKKPCRGVLVGAGASITASRGDPVLAGDDVLPYGVG